MKGKRQLALRLNKGFYCLKQSGRLWSMMLHGVLKSIGFIQSYTDSCLYIEEDVKGKTLMGIYVYDVISTGTSVQKVDKSSVHLYP